MVICFKSLGQLQNDLEAKTATSINGITFQMTEGTDGKWSGRCINPKEIPLDDLDDKILEKMVPDAGIYYERQLKKQQRRRALLALKF